jgi:predicted DNA-binding transcriptional regulator AlpA
VAEAAAYLGLSKKTIYNGISKRAKQKFPVKPKYYGRKPLFDVRDLDKFADSL